jgi:zinc resistance-associated protein
MLKSVVVATAALAIAGSSIVYAQQRFGGPGSDGPRSEHRHRLSPEDRAAFTDARIAALKAGLELTPDQAKNWPAFEQALRDMAQFRAERRKAREAREQQAEQGQTKPAPFERLARRADTLAKRSAVLKRIADTGGPLYMSLNDAQKERFKKLGHLLRHHHHHMHAWNHEGRGARGFRDGQGFGRDGEGGGRWQGHHGRRFGQEDGDQGGRFHRMIETQDRDSQL